MYDDSDMKIVGEYAPDADAADAENNAELEREQENGNLERARKFGTLLAQTLGQGESVNADNYAVTVQRWLLLMFAVEVQLDQLLPATVTAQTALSAFYETMRTDAEAVYEELQRNGSLSFYYLCLQDGEADEAKIGDTFASLCGHAGDPDFAAAGTQLYRSCVLQVKALSAVQGFVE